MEPGDIVTLAARSGPWVVAEPYPGPDGAPWWRLLNPELQSFVAPEAGLSLVSRPSFAAGERLKYWGRSLPVVSDDGATVTLHVESQKTLSDGATIDTSGPLAVPRAWVVAENATSILGT